MGQWAVGIRLYNNTSSFNTRIVDALEYGRWFVANRD